MRMEKGEAAAEGHHFCGQMLGNFDRKSFFSATASRCRGLYRNKNHSH